MYIETWGIVAAAAVICYLLWLVSRYKRLINDAGEFIKKTDRVYLNIQRELVDILIYEDSRFLAKVSKKTREKVLNEQANDLRVIYTNNQLGHTEIAGVVIEDDSPEEYLRSAVRSNSIDYFEDDIATTNWSIAESLDYRIDRITSKNKD